MKIKKLTETAIIPTRGSEKAAGFDLYADLKETVTINPGEKLKIPTGIATEIPDGYFGGLFARSGISCKRGLRPANCTGVIDSDYRGEICAVLYNDSKEAQTVKPGERIAQLIIMPYLNTDIQVCDELDDTQRGKGGFGSTGK